jgi:hypothetical protein
VFFSSFTTTLDSCCDPADLSKSVTEVPDGIAGDGGGLGRNRLVFLMGTADGGGFKVLSSFREYL